MKIKLYILVTCALLSVGSSIILQAMQEQQETAEQSTINKFYYNIITSLIRRNNPQEAIKMLQEGIDRGFDVNYYDDFFQGSLLTQALEIGNVELINALLATGAKPNIEARLGEPIPPLYAAILHYKLPASIIEKLIKAGADVNAIGAHGMTPLVWAIRQQNIPAIKTLLRVPNIDLMAKNPRGQTAYDIAKMTGNTEILEILKPYYMTLKDLGIEAVKKYRGQEIPEEEIQQRLPQELQEELRR